MGRKNKNSLERSPSRREYNTKEDEKELTRLRASIGEITQSIVDLISARQKLSTEVARIKRKNGSPIENLEVESQLRAKVRDYARKADVDQLLATGILSLILESSKTVQRKAYYEGSIRSFLKEQNIERIAIIGAGRMGRWFASYFADLSYSPIIFDQVSKKASQLASELNGRWTKNLERVAEEADLVIVAIPISDTPRMIKKLTSLSKERKSLLRVIELSSVKKPLVHGGLVGKNASSFHGRLSLHSIHPMFGPDAKHFAQNKMLEVSEGKANENGLIQGLFPHFSIYRLDSKTHDKMMSYILSLPHLLALLFADLTSSESSTLKRYSGPSFDRMVDLANRVLSENAAVYFEIQRSNSKNLEMVKELRRSLDKLTALTSDKKSFKKFFETVRN